MYRSSSGCLSIRRHHSSHMDHYKNRRTLEACQYPSLLMAQNLSHPTGVMPFDCGTYQTDPGSPSSRTHTMAFSADSAQIILQSLDHTNRLWNLARSLISTFSQVTSSLDDRSKSRSSGDNEIFMVYIGSSTRPTCSRRT